MFLFAKSRPQFRQDLYAIQNTVIMDKTVQHKDLSLVPEIRNLHPALFHSSPHKGNEPHGLVRDTTDLEVIKSLPNAPTVVERVVGVVKDNFKSLFVTVIIVLVILLETALDQALFQCPCSTKEANVGYSVIFVTAPSVALLIMGILGNNSTWRLVTGCWYRTKDSYHGLYRACEFVTDVLAKALFAPAAWITYAFIDGRFYVCAVDDDPCDEATPTAAPDPDGASETRQEAQIIGYAMLIALAGFVLVCILLKKGCSRYTYEQDDYIQIYRTVERVEMQKQLEVKATEVAQRVVRAFVQKQSRDKSDWDALTQGHLARRPDAGEPWTPMQKIFLRESGATENERVASVETQTSELRDDHDTDAPPLKF